jgi:hypothetical protein
VNFSDDYLHRPANEVAPKPLPADRPARATLATTFRWSALRALAGRGRRALRRLCRPDTPATDWMSEVPFDLYCLLLPNLFDEMVSNYRLTDREAYISLFARFGALLDGEGAGACAELVEALDAASEAVVLLTTNLSEAAKMDEESELAAYLEVVAGPEADGGAAVIIKPHPRDNVDKIARLRERLGQSFRRVVVLDDPMLFYLPFEVIWAKHFLPRLGRDIANSPGSE